MQGVRYIGCTFFLIVILYYVTISGQFDSTSDREESIPTPQIWVSMSLCWAENAQIYGKHNFPYDHAAELSSKLWRNITDGEVRVALTIVHSDLTYGSDLQSYKDSLEREGVLVVLEKAGSTGCVLQSQLSRMFLFTNPAIDAEDIILVSDVDIFIMDRRILDPLKKPFRTWIYSYGLTEREGYTFAMSIIGMRAKDWREILDYSHVGIEGYNISDIVQHFNKTLGFTSSSLTWGADQAILSYSILSRGFCSLPPENPLWKTLALTPASPSAKYASLCYHGQEETCHKKRTVVPRGCLWWHFHPDETIENLNRKYNQIMKFKTKVP